MKSARRIVPIALSLLILAACATTKVSNQQVEVADEKLPRPDRILVYDFGTSAAEVAPDSLLAGTDDAEPTPTPDEIAQGRELGAEIARELTTQIDAMGIPAVTATGQTQPYLNDLVIRGYFVSIKQGSAAERMLIGFGAGAAELKTVVEIYQMTSHGLRKLGSGEVASGGPKGPGAAVPAAVAIATANPIGLIVTSAIKVGGEVSGHSTIQGRAKATAQEIAAELKPRLQKRGWIP